MGLEELAETALVVGGTVYVFDKLTGKKRKLAKRTPKKRTVKRKKR